MDSIDPEKEREHIEECPNADVIYCEDQMETTPVAAEVSPAIAQNKWYRFDNLKDAQGYNILQLAIAPIVMSNVFQANSLLYLASEAAGCVSDDELIDECQNKVYGFSPDALVSNIAVISGVLSALFMPVAGAMIDYTHHRKTIGIISASLLAATQAVQIGTSSNTWFAMAIIQAFTRFLYQVQMLATYAYLPEISRRAAGEKRMAQFMTIFFLCFFASQVTFLILVVGLSTAFSLDDVQTAQVSQSINFVWIFIIFWIGWKTMPSIPARHSLPPHHSLATEGFVQIYHTGKQINHEYKHGIRWFFLAVMFGEAGMFALIVLAVAFLNDFGLSATEIGIFFLITVIFTLPGTKAACSVMVRLDPNRAWQISMVLLAVVTAVGPFIIVHYKAVSYGWGACIGFLAGWFYTSDNLFFSTILPIGQEAEMSGFFVYCTQILSWAPPLIYSILIENDVSQSYGVTTISAFFLIASFLASRAAPWSEIVGAVNPVGNA